MRNNEGQGEITMRMINMRTLVEDMTGLLEASVSRKAVLKFDMPSDPIHIKGDPTRVRLIIMNLVKNATDLASNGETVINLGMGVKSCGPAYLKRQFLGEDLPEGDYAFFEVSGGSFGMNPGVNGRDSDFMATKTVMEGIPSMAIVKGIIQAHKGTITVEKKPGGSSAILVLFPAMEMVKRKTREMASELPKTPCDGNDTVLLVDDEEMVLRVAKAMLERIGLHVMTAVDGKDAVETFQKYSDAIQCVILNMTMPRMGGEKCFKELMRIDPYANVIVASGYTEDLVLPLFTNALPAGFIQKPYNFNEFPNKVKAVLDKGAMPAMLN